MMDKQIKLRRSRREIWASGHATGLRERLSKATRLWNDEEWWVFRGCQRYPGKG